MSSRSIGVTNVVLSRLDDVVGDPVALLLGLEQVAAEPLVLGPGLEHVPQQLGASAAVFWPASVKQVEEDAILRNQGEPGHGRRT